MLAILRPGPFVGAGFDAGGLPGWLIDGKPEIVRTGAGAFKEAVSRWFSSVFNQIGDLQITSSGAGGPIALIQNEHTWLRGDDAQATAYLGETARFLREAGATVPLINANNLFAAADNEIDAWLGGDHLFTTLRQLRTVRPDAPPIALDIPLARLTAFGEKPTPMSPDQALRTLAQSLAAGGQFTVDSFAAGLTPGFLAGRDANDSDRFFTSAYAPLAPLSAGGNRTNLFAAVKRIVTFVTRFQSVVSHLENDSPAVVVNPDRDPSHVSVVHAQGDRGSVAYLFAPRAGKPTPLQLALSDGQSLAVDMSSQSSAWLLFNANLGKHAVLDWCNLCPFASVGDVFVCFGKPGASAALSINDTPLHATVPTGKTPLILEHENITVAICSYNQIDAACATDDAVYIGCDRLDESGEPITHPNFATCWRLSSRGAVDKISMTPPAKRRSRPRLTAWSIAPDPALLTDASLQSFTQIETPQPSVALGAPAGYLWLRARFRTVKPQHYTLGFFELRDRAHVFLDSKPLGVVGDGFGAVGALLPLDLSKDEHTLTLLIDQLGRPSGGAAMGQAVGMIDTLWNVVPFKLPQPQHITAEPISPVLSLPTRVWDLHDDELTNPSRIQWSFTYRRLAPLYCHVAADDASAVVLLNDQPIAWLTAGGPTRFRLPIDALHRGANVLQLAALDDPQHTLDNLAASLSLYEALRPMSKKPTWEIARWTPPEANQFAPASASTFKKYTGAPTWWRSPFKHKPTDAPIAFDPTGLSKGQIFLNGHNVGRYVAAITGASAPHAVPIPLPTSWLNAGGVNTLTIFDELGASPESCRLIPA